MKVAVWEDPRHGPALVALEPTDNGPLRVERIPDVIPPGVLRQLGAKGSKVGWPEWFEHLTTVVPHYGQWTVQEVPDGMRQHAVLGYLRRRAAGILGSSQGLYQLPATVAGQGTAGRQSEGAHHVGDADYRGTFHR